MSEIKKYTINIWLKNNSAPFIYRNCIAYEKGSFYCVFDGEAVYKYPLSDIWRVSESYPQDMQGKNNHNALRQKSVDSEERAHLEKLVPDLKKRIAELEAENDQLTAHSDIERQDDKSPNDTQTSTIVYGKENEMRVFKDGNAWCFVLPDFQDLQVSSSVWMKKGVLDKIYKELRSARDE